jgi:hypothetical protein
MNVRKIVALTVAGMLGMAGVDAARGAIAIDQITDINGGGVGFGGAVNVFASAGGAPFQVDETGVFMNNDIIVYTMDGIGAGDGAGLSIGISNGENGITQTAAPGHPEDPPGSPNFDDDNVEPTHPVFSTIGNASGRLENGNAIRFSMWMRQDPASPVVKQPQVEPVIKIELWKEALSGFADFNTIDFPGSGDRLWDADQNGFNWPAQSQASWVDMNNNGAIANGRPVAESLVTDEWRLVEATLIVDDDPAGAGLPEGGWAIGGEIFDVSAVEEIRAVLFVGDFAATDLTAGGSMWVDNLMLEVFATEAVMLATANPNTAPIELAGLPGDYNGDGFIDAADYTVWRNNLGGDPAALEAGSRDPLNISPTINGDDYTFWKDNYGGGLGSGGLAGSVVPEPSTFVMILTAVLALGGIRRSSCVR